MNRIFIFTIGFLTAFYMSIAQGAEQVTTEVAPATGSQHESLYNFSFSPLGLAIGMVNLNVSRKVNESWAIGMGGSLWDLTILNSHFHSATISMNADWFKNGIYKSGVFVSPSIGYTDSNFSYNFKSSTGQASVNSPFLGILAGYGWYWTSFNMRLGGGVVMYSRTTEMTLKDTDKNDSSEKKWNSSGGLAADFNLGWVF